MSYNDLDFFGDVAPETSPETSPKKSTILFHLIEEDSYEYTRWNHDLKKEEYVGLGIDDIFYEGGSAEIDAYDGMLTYSISHMLDHKEHVKGWWLMEGYYGRFSKDYYGEVDCDHECDDIRPAKWSDMKKFGLNIPIIPKIFSWFGIDIKVPNDYWID